MEPFTIKEEQYFTIEPWSSANPPLVAGFTTKNGGKSKNELSSLNLAFHVHDSEETVCANRDIVAQKLRFPLRKWVGAEQTHETHIVEITQNDRGKGAFNYKNAFLQTDGFFTLEKGILLTLCYADCVPIYFLHERSKAIGIAHAGWQGTVKGIAKEMISVFVAHKIPVEEIKVVIGPSISDEHYVVDNRVIKEVDKMIRPKSHKPYLLVSPGQYKLNLQGLNEQILLDAGIKKEHILITSYCTSKDENYFFSHRRDKGKTGRMLSFIGWREDVAD